MPQEGGVESGFRRSQTSGTVHRLYQIKGKRNIRAKEVALSWSSFNKGDCFILDLGEVRSLTQSTDAAHAKRLHGVNPALIVCPADHRVLERIEGQHL